jgi:hypothetical protein
MEVPAVDHRFASPRSVATKPLDATFFLRHPSFLLPAAALRAELKRLLTPPKPFIGNIHGFLENICGAQKIILFLFNLAPIGAAIEGIKASLNGSVGQAESLPIDATPHRRSRCKSTCEVLELPADSESFHRDFSPGTLPQVVHQRLAITLAGNRA